MSHDDLILFFLQVCVMLAVALAGGHIMRKLHQPAVLGELIAGILLGPTVFGLIAPNLFGALFPADARASLGLEAVIKIGMLFFLFVAGLEVNMAHIWQRSSGVVLTGTLGILVPLTLGIGSVLLLPQLWAPYSPQQNWILALFVGTALSISALPVIARILMDLGLIRQEIGGVVLTAATINDLIGWSLFAVVLSMVAPASPVEQSIWTTLGLIAGFLILLLIFGGWLSRPILYWSRSALVWPSGFIGLITILVLVAAVIAESIGIHAIFGAFLVGVIFGQSIEKENQAHNIIYQFAVSFFAPLYFVSIGLQADFATNFDWQLVLMVLLVACLGKIGGAGLGAWLGGMNSKQALAVGFGMNARGAMEIILATVALEYRLIDQRVFVALVIMALVTTMLSGPVMQRLVHKTV